MSRPGLSPKLATLLAAAFVLAGCATAPAPLRGDYAPLTPADAASTAAVGASVRWGGTIAAVEPRRDSTCLQIVGRDLGSLARPRSDDSTTGRFLACRAGFYDPQVFATGREVTVVGRIDGMETRLIGEYEYRHPRVAADVIYLWPPRQEVDPRWRDPWYYPYPYWYGPRHWWWW